MKSTTLIFGRNCECIHCSLIEPFERELHRMMMKVKATKDGKILEEFILFLIVCTHMKGHDKRMSSN